MVSEKLSPQVKREFHKRLLRWFEDNRREMPWRATSNPYHVAIAELMLLRTKADQVVKVYTQFLKRFPTVEALANAQPEDIASVAASLGLRWRVRKIADFARDIVTMFGGEIPREREDLLSVTGIGSYTADAIRCFAFREPCLVVDANTSRLLDRFFGLCETGELRRKRTIMEAAGVLVPESSPREFNWALLDLCAGVCRARAPLCDRCPLQGLCHHGRKT